MNAVVLLSGGLDSSVLLHYVHHRLGVPNLYVLSFNYGQKHARELEMARWQCARLPAVRCHQILDIAFLGELTAGASALTGTRLPVPDLDQVPPADRTQPITYVPHRNLILLALAAGFAEANHCPDVYYGAQAQDEYGYWDCTADFVQRLNHTLALNRRTPIQIRAPFTGLRKSQELALGRELGVDFAHTWSCYRGGELACGRCPTCVERLRAFAEAGQPDPLPYAQPSSQA